MKHVARRKVKLPVAVKFLERARQRLSALESERDAAAKNVTRFDDHAAQAWVLGEMAKKARHVYWLNPEPRSYWDTGDSIVSQYATHCDGAYECRNLKQLERFVEQLG